MSHFFFFSCAGGDIDDSLTQFFEDLRQEVADLTGCDRKSAGFIFRQESSVGTDWPSSAGQALADCKVFVPVYTSRFMASSNCGREYYAFRQRLLRARLRWERIVPIWWTPPIDGLPAAISQVVDPRSLLKLDHAKHGLKLIFRERGNVGSPYPKLLATLAEMIVERGQAEPELHPVGIPDLARGPNIFDETVLGTSARHRPGGPKRVNFLVLSGTRDEMGAVPGRTKTDYYGDSREEWNPFHPSTVRALAIEACEVACQQPGQVFSVAYSAPSALNLFIEQKEEEREMVVLLVDSWAAFLGALSTSLAEYDTRRFLNSAVVVPFPADDEETSRHETDLRGKLYEKIPRTMGGEPTFYREDPGSLAAFRAVIAQVLQSLLASIVMAGPPIRKSFPGDRETMPMLIPPTGL